MKPPDPKDTTHCRGRFATIGRQAGFERRRAGWAGPAAGTSRPPIGRAFSRDASALVIARHQYVRRTVRRCHAADSLLRRFDLAFVLRQQRPNRMHPEGTIMKGSFVGMCVVVVCAAALALGARPAAESPREDLEGSWPIGCARTPWSSSDSIIRSTRAQSVRS